MARYCYPESVTVSIRLHLRQFITFFVSRCAIDNRSDINRVVQLAMNAIQLKMLSHWNNKRAGRDPFCRDASRTTRIIYGVSRNLTGRTRFAFFDGRYMWNHPIVMFIAVCIFHKLLNWRDDPDPNLLYRLVEEL